MEDDIDIEEHDVLDNPRIKSMFPDLSMVKIEIPDEEEIEEYYEEVQIEYHPPEMLYECEFNQEITTEDIPEPTTTEYEGEASYFFNNEIILGSKPTVDNELLYQEALHSSSVVFLENWEDRLKNSLCYCEPCSILFPTVNALDAHKMTNHSYLVALDTSQRNTARKSTVPSKYCNHCSKTFPDDTALIKHLYELLPMNNFPEVKVEKTEEVNEEVETHPFQCHKCKKTFSTYSAGRWHRKIAHPSLSHVQHLISKISPKRRLIPKAEIKTEPKEEKKKVKPKGRGLMKRHGKFFATSSLVPKSTLFQCNVCQICFMSCFSAIQHANSCEKALPHNKCGICKRKIRVKDEKIHALQHNYTDKLKIYTIHKNIYEKVLCKCPKCLACSDELLFWAHYRSCENSGSAYCPDCDLNIATARYDSHRLKHSDKKLTKKDFIVIEFHDQKRQPNSDLRIQIMRKERIKDRNKKWQERNFNIKMGKSVPNNITLYYCDYCGCCQHILSHKGHYDGRCKKRLMKRFCDKCGLCFSDKCMKNHRILHERRSFTLKDIKFVSLATGDHIDTPITELYQCKDCENNFLTKKLVRIHDCKTEKHIVCKICSKKFNLQAYKVHKICHSIDRGLIPELLKKYNSLTSKWNVIYVCGACNLVTVSYDSAVDHAQCHLNDIQSDLHKHCPICNLNIAENCYRSHEELHINNQAIDRSSFRFLTYNYEDLLKNEWMTLFDPLPKQHVHQILSKSIYRYTRDVKMNIEVTAPTEDTKFLCMNCKSFVEGIRISQHLQSKCQHNDKYSCRVCRDVFKSLKHFVAHEGSHTKAAKRRRIVTFNNESDKEFNSKLNSNDNRLKNSKGAKSKARDVPECVKKKYKIYKCAKCFVCVSLESSSRRHQCVTDADKRFCLICDQYFTRRKMPMHMAAHKNKPNVTKDTLAVVFFNNAEKKPRPPSTAPKTVASVYKCDCGLHFTSMKTITKHLDVCSPDLEVSKEVCSKCNLIFPTEVLVTHLCNHHSKDTKIVAQNIKRVLLYKCAHCRLLFVSTDSFNDHLEKCDPKYGRVCQECHLNFGKYCFHKHKCSLRNNSAHTTYINKVTLIRKSVKVYTVYKCEPCNISYLKYNSFKYHLLDVNHENKVQLTFCEYCGLRFTHNSWQKHVKIHKTNVDNYRIKVIDPVNGTSVMVAGKNPGASDKNQNSDRRLAVNRKRVCTNMATRGALSKKPKKSPTDSEIEVNNDTHRSSNKITEFLIEPSTSKHSNTDDIVNESEIIVPDSISDHTLIESDISQDIENFDTSEMIVPDNLNNDNENIISLKMKARILVHKYNRQLYRCVYCNQHYMKDSSFDYHIRSHDHSVMPESYKCDICDLDFSKHTLPRHKYVHHHKMGLNKEDFVIKTETSYTRETNIFEKIDNKLLFLNNTTNEQVIYEVMEDPIEVTENAPEITEDSSNESKITSKPTQSASEISETNSEITEDASELNDNTADDTDNSSDITNMTTEASQNVSEICETSSEVTKAYSDSEKICYYKCFECNVCFISQKMCYNHTLKHEVLDPKTYIQCKICDFQFMIDSLKEHMDAHHSTDFRVSNLTIEEYRPLGDGVEPKLDTYQAVDKVQSRLISTTTDVGVV